MSESTEKSTSQPIVGLVSLGCPKALVDSEGIVTTLRAQGYQFSSDYENADAVIINTCGFLDSAKEESLSTIAEAMEENGTVIVTGCLGVEADMIRKKYPQVAAITGPHARDDVVQAVNTLLPKPHDPFEDLIPEHGIKLTPKHYSYLKISEGCSNRCSFCIIPSIRGNLVSRPIPSVLHEAERLVKAGTKELLIISQDTSAYGQDIKYAEYPYHGRDIETRFYNLVEELSQMDVWTRLHYVYPYPHVDAIIPLMNEGHVLPYLDIPFQHAAPGVLKNMRRPASSEKTIQRIQNWRKLCPDLAIRSTFIIGFPGETEEDFEILLDWLDETRIDRIGAFKYEPVAGARSNELGLEMVTDEVKEERWQRFMEKARLISAECLRQKIGQEIEVIVDATDGFEDETYARSIWDAPEIDGRVIIEDESDYEPGDKVKVCVVDSDDYDLYAEPIRYNT